MSLPKITSVRTFSMGICLFAPCRDYIYKQSLQRVFDDEPGVFGDPSSI
jgi:hypothetical protein